MADATWPHILTALLNREDLQSEQTAWAMSEIVGGNATDAQIAAFTVALRAKGETPEEVSGLAESVIAAATRVVLDRDAVDVVGTGGDRARTVNISTMAAIVVAGAGVPVVKHGGRAVSSACGSADVLSELGVSLTLSAESVARCVREAGIGFCFAPRFHAGMRHAAGPRREMGIPTFFNFVGPLINPAQPRASAVGCSDLRMAPVMAQVFANRGHSAIVVRGEDGLDEITTTGPTRLWVAHERQVHPITIDVADLGVARANISDLVGGDLVYNAAVVRQVVGGERGAVRDAVIVNAAAAIAVFDRRTDDIMAGLAEGMRRAEASIDSGSAADTLDRWIGISEEEDAPANA